MKRKMRCCLAVLLVLVLLLPGCRLVEEEAFRLTGQLLGNKLPLPIDRELHFGMTTPQVEAQWGEPETTADVSANGGKELIYSRTFLGVTATVHMGFYPIGTTYQVHHLIIKLPYTDKLECQRLVRDLVAEIESVYGSNKAFSWQQKPEETGATLEGAFTIDLGATGLYGTITGDGENIVLQCYNVE